MPHAITLSPEHGIAVVRMAGAVDGVEVVTAAAELVAHPDWRGGFRPVWDMRAVTSLDFSPDHMTTMLAQEARFEEAGDAGDSIVITRDDVTAGLVLILQAHARRSGRTSRPCRQSRRPRRCWASRCRSSAARPLWRPPTARPSRSGWSVVGGLKHGVV